MRHTRQRVCVCHTTRKGMRESCTELATYDTVTEPDRQRDTKPDTNTHTHACHRCTKELYNQINGKHDQAAGVLLVSPAPCHRCIALHLVFCVCVSFNRSLIA